MKTEWTYQHNAFNWTHWRLKLRASTVAIYKGAWERFVCWVKKCNYETSSYSQTLQLYQQALLDAGRSPQTVNTEITMLTRLLLTIDATVSRPTRVSVAAFKERLRERHVLTDATVKAVLTHETDLHRQLLWALLATSGLRIQEAVGLRYSDIYMHEAAVSVRGKRDTHYRFVPAALQVWEALRQMRLNWQSTDPDHFDLNALIWDVSATTARAWLKEACENARVQPFTPVELRRFVATKLTEQLSLTAAQLQLGHASVNTTRLYINRVESG